MTATPRPAAAAQATRVSRAASHTPPTRQSTVTTTDSVSVSPPARRPVRSVGRWTRPQASSASAAGQRRADRSAGELLWLPGPAASAPSRDAPVRLAASRERCGPAGAGAGSPADPAFHSAVFPCSVGCQSLLSVPRMPTSRTTSSIGLPTAAARSVVSAWWSSYPEAFRRASSSRTSSRGRVTAAARSATSAGLDSSPVSWSRATSAATSFTGRSVAAVVRRVWTASSPVSCWSGTSGTARASSPGSAGAVGGAAGGSTGGSTGGPAGGSNRHVSGGAASPRWAGSTGAAGRTGTSGAA